MKTCNRCKKKKELTEFYKTRKYYNSYCKECQSKNSKWRAAKKVQLEEAKKRSGEMKVLKEKIKEERKHCRACKGYVLEENMYNERICKWCHGNVKDWKKY